MRSENNHFRIRNRSCTKTFKIYNLRNSKKDANAVVSGLESDDLKAAADRCERQLSACLHPLPPAVGSTPIKRGDGGQRKRRSLYLLVPVRRLRAYPPKSLTQPPVLCKIQQQITQPMRVQTRRTCNTITSTTRNETVWATIQRHKN